MTTTQINTAELSGAAFDWAVAQATGEQWSHHSTDWALGGPLIDEYTILFDTDDGSVIWAKTPGQLIWQGGSTHLIAACRAVICSKLGPTVSVPTELVEGGV